MFCETDGKCCKLRRSPASTTRSNRRPSLKLKQKRGWNETGSKKGRSTTRGLPGHRKEECPADPQRTKRGQEPWSTVANHSTDQLVLKRTIFNTRGKRRRTSKGARTESSEVAPAEPRPFRGPGRQTFAHESAQVGPAWEPPNRPDAW